MLILSWNCGNGLKSKVDSVKYILNKSGPDLLFVHEAEVKQEHVPYFKIKGYDFITSKSIEGPFKQARTICYVKNTSDVKPKIIETRDDKIDLIMFDCGHFAVAGLYRGFRTPPNLQPEQFFNLYINKLDSIVTNQKFKDVIILGDFNIDPIRDLDKWHGRMLESWTSDNLLTQHITGTTRHRPVLSQQGYTLQKSQIDLIYTRNILPGIQFRKRSDYGSDHVCLEVNYIQEIPKTTKKIKIRDATKLTEHNIQREAWSLNENPQDLQSINKIHRKILNKLAPFRTIHIRDESHIVNPRIEKVRKRRDRLYRQYKKSNREDILIKVKEETKRLKNVIKREAFIRLKNKAQTPNVDCFWKVVNELQGKNIRTNITSIIDESGSTVTGDNNIADTLVNFFRNKINTLRQGHLPLENTENLMTQLKKDGVVEFTYEEVQAAVKNLKPKMSYGPDGIPAKIAKYAFPMMIDR